MIIRVVRMEFEPTKVAEFLLLFEEVKSEIINFSGCNYLQLCKDAGADHVYYTFSRWDGEEDLENYRNSELFKDTWAKTKILFGGKPLAYSLLDDPNMQVIA